MSIPCWPSQIEVTPPSFRSDLQLDVDVIEEIARIYGYHNLPSTLMNTPIPTTKQAGTDFIVEERVKRFLAASGAQELYTYSMVSEARALEDGFSLSEHLKLSNPLTDDRVYLRRSLLPSLVEALEEMMRPGLVVFELANVYHPQENALPIEQLHLSIVSNCEYRQLRTQVEAMLATMHITKMRIDTESHCLTAGEMDTVIGVVTQLGSYVAFDFIWSELLQIATTHPHYIPLAKAAPLTEDLTFTLPARTAVGPIISAMLAVSPLIHSVTLGAQYKQNFTFRCTYLNPDQPISSDEVAPIRAQLVETVQRVAQATLVGTLQ